MKGTTISLPEELPRAVEREARRCGISLSKAARRARAAHLARDPPASLRRHGAHRPAGHRSAGGGDPRRGAGPRETGSGTAGPSSFFPEAQEAVAEPRNPPEVPELPEVETVRRGLERHLPGRRIESVELRCEDLLGRPDPESFCRALPGQTFRRLDRLGKMLILELDHQGLLVHLGMTGQLTFWDPAHPEGQGPAAPPAPGHPVRDRHLHLILHLEGAAALLYRDVRRFGKWRMDPLETLRRAPELVRLGPDPLTPEYRFEAFSAALRRTRRRIKAALLDQRVVAGLGNIYADEALHRAGIRPHRRCHRLTEGQKRCLFEAIPEVLRQGIASRGTTFSDFVGADGSPGGHLARLRAYGRAGQPCAGCGASLVRTTVAGRSSTWCRHCQR